MVSSSSDITQFSNYILLMNAVTVLKFSTRFSLIVSIAIPKAIVITK